MKCCFSSSCFKFNFVSVSMAFSSKLFSPFSSSSLLYTDKNPSNAILEADTWNRYLPALMLIEIVSYSALLIRLAVKRFQMN